MCANWGVEVWKVEKGVYFERRKWSVWDWRNPYLQHPRLFSLDIKRQQVKEFMVERWLINVVCHKSGS